MRGSAAPVTFDGLYVRFKVEVTDLPRDRTGGRCSVTIRDAAVGIGGNTYQNPQSSLAAGPVDRMRIAKVYRWAQAEWSSGSEHKITGSRVMWCEKLNSQFIRNKDPFFLRALWTAAYCTPSDCVVELWVGTYV